MTRRALASLSLPLLAAACSPDAAAPAIGACTYTNRFSKAEECREYVGAWTEADAEADCSGQDAALEPGACDYPSVLGACEIKAGAERSVRVVFPGDDAAQCAAQKQGCEVFAGGTFEPSALCEGASDEVPVDPEAVVFQWPTLECRDPLPGEPPGASEGGQVCTWNMISGSTEAGRRFQDYARCDMVLTQRPYSPVPPPEPFMADDPRLDDPAYAEELAWVTSQVEASACVCCHKSSLTPAGAAIWDIEAEGNWMNTFTPYGLAFAGGFIDSSLLGAYPPEDNNGFSRDMPDAPGPGLPTTDPARMQAFFAAELEFRGTSPAAFADAPPTPALFHQQQQYAPEACEDGVGLAPDGTLHWAGGRARYVYVLAAGSDNPLVPPNLDLPEGTLWRLDVPSDSAPVASGLAYGVVPEGLRQGFPKSGEAAPLQPGESYYLYVLADIIVPLTRCVFTAP